MTPIYATCLYFTAPKKLVFVGAFIRLYNLPKNQGVTAILHPDDKNFNKTEYASKGGVDRRIRRKFLGWKPADFGYMW